MKCTVLIVDDEIEILEVMKELLTYHGFRAITAASVKEARIALESESIDLVLSDVLMPEATGTVLRRYMQNDERYQGIPFVFITAFAPTSEALSGPVLGKPFQTEDLLTLIDKVLSATYRVPYYSAYASSRSVSNDVYH
ncbi:response regulator [Oxalicibacterium faecigallinarum]|uniref:Response regulatory domain-containing protein n=1 Tax=Oxalicibacterium faecigallinarum TaxID=573741 RepID=A0A8J3ANQ1_9BURK|nr:response regulator [Oxalicibacterium faecigallinarum]GGI17140.1 hypothetical protein GCM10008066_07490 [Oxalicibacterium faecigallinarum]